MDITQGVPFDTFGLSEATMRAIRNKGYTISTPVQAGCIPPMLAGKDVIAKAPTGTGKTMAFGLPIIERMDRESEAVQALILAPTRELAMQIPQELREVAVYHEGLRVVCLYGGEPIGKQINALKRKPQIVVATPGRLSDHMKRRTVTVKEVQTVVLDEADRMLDMGFIHDVTRILDKIPDLAGGQGEAECQDRLDVSEYHVVHRLCCSFVYVCPFLLYSFASSRRHLDKPSERSLSSAGTSTTAEYAEAL